MDNVATYLAGVPAFLAYFGVSVGLLALFVVIFTRLTPHNEHQLILSNTPASAVAFGGSVIGFVLPLASAISHSVSLLDCVLWGLVALIVQVATFFVIRLMVPGLSARIENNEQASGILVAALSVAVGLLNAASMTY